MIHTKVVPIRRYGKYIIFYVHFIIMLISNIVYLRVDRIVIKLRGFDYYTCI
jgi:hypothetical protein